MGSGELGLPKVYAADMDAGLEKRWDRSCTALHPFYLITKLSGLD